MCLQSINLYKHVYDKWFVSPSQECRLYPVQESPFSIKQLCRYHGKSHLPWDTLLYATIHSLSVVNTSNDSVIVARNILARNATVYTELFSIPHAGQACSQLEINLAAANVIGESGVGTTTARFPVSKLLSFNS